MKFDESDRETLNKIHETLRDIKRILEKNSKTDDLNQDPFVYGYDSPPQPYEVDLLTQQKCSKCGLVWSGVMGYVCADEKCPIQMKTNCEVS